MLFIALALAHPHHLTPKQIERIEYRKCGPDGTVDWDPNPEFPPPHCNRDGWNGKRYVPEKRRRRSAEGDE